MNFDTADWKSRGAVWHAYQLATHESRRAYREEMHLGLTVVNKG